eukprot:m.91094 g.91094  ORF g.91094 m.91094 type:complete len:75 (+) comp8485_c0_seq3:2070-2294(+)
MAEPESVGGLRGLTNKINIAKGLRWSLRTLHREPVVVVSILLAAAGPLFVVAMDPTEPSRNLDIKKAVYGSDSK